jgi:hypothetical protein
MKYTVFFSKGAMMYGVETDTGKGFKQQVPPPKHRKGQSYYTIYRGVAKRWAKQLEDTL